MHAGVWPGCAGAGLEVADGEAAVVFEQHVELAAVAGKTLAFVEQLAEHLLHHGDLVADRHPGAELCLEVGRGGQVIGVHVGLEDPVDLGVQFAHPGNQFVGGLGAGAAGLGVVVQHAVDQRAAPGVEVHHQVADGPCLVVEKGFYAQRCADDHWALEQ